MKSKIIKMSGEIVRPSEKISLSIDKRRTINEMVKPEGRYFLQCRGPRESVRNLYNEIMAEVAILQNLGHYQKAQKWLDDAFRMIEPKWAMEINNLVTDVGANDAQDKYFAGSAYTAAWYLFLMSATSYTTGPAVGDTSASHGGWTEDTNYDEAARPTAAFASAASRSKAFSAPLTFTMNASTTIKGSGLISSPTKGGTTGILYSVGAATEGDQAANNGDTINGNYTSTFA